MDARFLNSLLARLRFAATRLKPLPLIALALLAATIYFQWLALPQEAAALEAGERRLAAIERQTRRAAFADTAPVETPAAQRQQQLARFPEDSALAAELGRLVEQAGRQGLQVNGGDYRLQVAREGALLDRYVVNLPVKGEYRQVRAYLKAVRDAFPELAIEDVALRRDNIGSAEIEAQLRFVFFVRRAA